MAAVYSHPGGTHTMRGLTLGWLNRAAAGGFAHPVVGGAWPTFAADTWVPVTSYMATETPPPAGPGGIDFADMNHDALYAVPAGSTPEGAE
jgi:hypothetical protein